MALHVCILTYLKSVPLFGPRCIWRDVPTKLLISLVVTRRKDGATCALWLTAVNICITHVVRQHL